MEWIAEVDRIDRFLHSIGVPSAERHKAIETISNVLIQAGKQRRDRRQLVLEAVQRCHGNIRKAAKQEKWSHETFYKELRPKIVKSDMPA